MDASETIAGWLSSDDVLAVRDVSTPTATAESVSVRSRVRTKLAGLSVFLSRLGLDDRLKLSPDGRFVACRSSDRSQLYVVNVASGSPVVVAPAQKNSVPGSFRSISGYCWRSDSLGGCVIIADGMSDRRVGVMNWNTTAGFRPAEYPVPGGEWLPVGEPLFSLPNGYLVTALFDSYPQYRPVRMRQMSVVGGGENNEVDVPISAYSAVAGKKRIASARIINREEPIGVAAILGRLLHHQSGAEVSLWTTDLDGQNVLELGAITSPTAQSGQFNLVGWTPDGQYLSFVSDDTFYRARMR